jgi:hypothetical protein
MARARGMTDFVKLHHAYWHKETAMADANPQLIVERGEASVLPPALLIYGARTMFCQRTRLTDLRTPSVSRVETFPSEFIRARGHLFATKTPTSPAAQDANSGND